MTKSIVATICLLAAAPVVTQTAPNLELPNKFMVSVDAGVLPGGTPSGGTMATLGVGIGYFAQSLGLLLDIAYQPGGAENDYAVPHNDYRMTSLGRYSAGINTAVGFGVVANRFYLAPVIGIAFTDNVATSNVTGWTYSQGGSEVLFDGGGQLIGRLGETGQVLLYGG